MAEYLIKKDKRRPSNFFKWFSFVSLFYNSKIAFFKVRFTKSCIYGLENLKEYGVNKLFGLTFGLFGVHKNSARFGWRPINENEIMLYAYCYIDGERKITPFVSMPIEQIFFLNIQVEPGRYIFVSRNANETEIKKLEIKHNKISKFGYFNFLYFGGDKKCPQDMIIHMR